MQGAAQSDTDRLPPIRQELTLYQGACEENGSPSWILHDPSANQFYNLSWIGFEILSRWKLASSAAIIDAVNSETTLTIGVENIAEMTSFLHQSNLLQVASPADSQRLVAIKASKWQYPLRRLLKSYLFFRIPLIRPERFLEKLAPFTQWAFARSFWLLVALCALSGGYLALRQWDSFLGTFSAFGAWHQLAFLSIALVVTKIIHEFGHALTAQRFGCRVGSMGLAFLVLWPMLYTDVNEAWKLPSKRHRLLIGSAGMLSELALASFATLLWSFLPDGPLRAAVFFMATTSWILTLTFNLNPCMRFDGYFLLSDFLGIKNLHERSFALARWWLRELLFGLREPQPEYFPPERQRMMILFAFAVWVYRFFLYLSICVMVYFLFFKLLGIFLMGVEVVWFILLPMFGELKQWWARRQMLNFNRNTLTTALIFLLFLGALLIPWHSNINAPATFGAQQYQTIYTPLAAKVAQANIRVGQRVKQGDLLLQLESPDMDFRIAEAQQEVELLQWQLKKQPLHKTILQQGFALQNRLEEAISRLHTAQDKAARLTIVAPFSGQIREINDSIVPGVWFQEDEPLLLLVETGTLQLVAFIEEADLERIAPNSVAKFYPEAAGWNSMECRVSEIEQINIEQLDKPLLASYYGGALAVQKNSSGRMIPEFPYYKVLLNDCSQWLGSDVEIRGTVHLQGKPESFLRKGYRQVVSVLIRESSF